MSSKSSPSAQFRMIVSLVDERQTTHTFHTIKAARHYAKDACNKPGVVKIVVTGPDIPATVMFEA